MRARVAEYAVRRGLLGPKIRLRVDLHGVSVFGPGDARTLIRWEWITSIQVEGGVVVRSDAAEVRFPPGAFKLQPEELAARLEDARNIAKRPEVIGTLL